MKIRTSKIFDKDYQKMPFPVKKRAKKQFAFLLEDWRHPSLGVKKVKSERGVWEARLTKSYRFTFEIRGKIIFLRRIGRHDEVLKRL